MILTSRSVRRWYRIHKWTSLVCTAFLLMLCITGLPLIFSDQISHFTEHHINPARVAPNTPVLSLDAILQEAKHLYPKLRPLALGWDGNEPYVFVNMISDSKAKANQEHDLIFDSHTGKLLDEPTSRKDLMGYILTLHTQMFAGLPGELFLGCMASLFVVALASGVIVYGPFMRKLNFGTVRKDKSTRLKWFDLHNLIGIVTISWGTVVGLTGAMNTLSGPLFDLWRGQEMPHLLAPYRNKPVLTQLVPVEIVIRTARNALPNMEISSIVFPNAEFGSPRHYLIWTHGKTEVMSRLFTPILIDAQTGQLITAKGLPWYLRALEVSRPLHFGDYGGMPLKIIWAIFDVALIAVLLSGVYLWLSRRKTPVEDELDRLVKLDDLAVKETQARTLAQ